jgi:fluoride ion exporter CrcB/FEX
MRFLNAVLWEFVQNFPVIMLFVIAVWLWARERKAESSLCAVSGAVIGSLAIRFTEPLASGYHEPWSITLVNVVTMSLLQILFTVYLGSEADWSNWKVDVVLGGLAGISLAVAQGLASQGSPLIEFVLQGIALITVSSVALVGIRQLKDKPLATALASVVLLGFVAALVSSVITYRYFLSN